MPPNKGLQLTPASWAFLGLVAFWHSTPWLPELRQPEPSLRCI